MAKRTPRKRPSKRLAISGHHVHAEYSRAVPERAALVDRHLTLLICVFRKLFSDENFVTLLRAESITAIPTFLAPAQAGKPLCQ